MAKAVDIYASLRIGVPGYDYVLTAYGDDEGFAEGLSRVVASVLDGVVTVGGWGTGTDSPSLHAYVFTPTTVIDWGWDAADGSTVVIRPRFDLLSIQVDEAPSDIDPRIGRLAYTLVYPWGSVALQERRGNSEPREAFAGFVADLGAHSRRSSPRIP
jgi:hypothetical protein